MNIALGFLDFAISSRKFERTICLETVVVVEVVVSVDVVESVFRSSLFLNFLKDKTAQKPANDDILHFTVNKY